MKSERPQDQGGELDRKPDSAEELVAWEQIEPGRFMPRRTRGSDRGRALG